MRVGGQPDCSFARLPKELAVFLLRLLGLRPFGLFLEGKSWYAYPKGHYANVDDPTQVGPNRSDPTHYDERGRYLWWGA